MRAAPLILMRAVLSAYAVAAAAHEPRALTGKHALSILLQRIAFERS